MGNLHVPELVHPQLPVPKSFGEAEKVVDPREQSRAWTFFSQDSFTTEFESEEPDLCFFAGLVSRGVT